MKKISLIIALLYTTQLAALMHGDYGCIAPNFTDDFDDCLVQYAVVVDRHLSPQAGAETIAATHRIYQGVDYFDMEPYILTNCDGWGFGLRLARLAFIEQPLADIITVTDHEFFGHGYRLRERGMDLAYDIDPPWPYGGGGGATFFMSTQFNELSQHQQAALHAAGVEATEILGREIGSKVVAHGCMDYREALLYHSSYHDLTEYVWSIRGLDEASDGHDIRDYVNKINAMYGREVLDHSDLSSWVWLNYVDPLTWWSYYTVWRYLWSAERCQEVKGLRLGDCRILPGLRLTLAPYGPEYSLYSYITCWHRVGTAYLRFGDTGGHSSFSIGAKAYELYEYGNWDLGGRLDLWWQPKINTPNPAKGGSQVGLAATVRGSYHMGGCWAATVEAGGKSAGYVPGESLNADYIVRLGITYYAP